MRQAHDHPLSALEPRREKVRVESEAVISGVVAAVVTSLVSIAVFANTYSALWGGVSVGLVAAIAVLISGALVGGYAYVRSLKSPHNANRARTRSWKFVLDVSVVAVVHAVIGAILMVAIFLLLQRSFEGLKVDVYVSVASVAMASGLCGYWIFLSASRITTSKLSSLLVAFMATATIMSMATSQDPKWWEYHFSQLGTLGSFSSTLFNTSLIIAGLFVTTFSLYLHNDLSRLLAQGTLKRAWAPKFVSTTFAAMGVMLAGVGVFPLTFSVTLHNLCAAGMALTFSLLLITSPFALSGMPRRLYIFCAGTLLVLIAAFLLFEPVGYFNLTAFELVAFVAIFGWIAVFIRFVNALVEDEAELVHT